MAIRIRFDSSKNVIQPNFVLATRNGKRIGSIPAYDVSLSDGMNESTSVTFRVNKLDCVPLDGIVDGETIWDSLVDFKLMWVKDWNKFFEVYVKINETEATIKDVTATSLGEAELSQILLHNININNETDILRDDYSPSVIYNSDPSKSILNRILEKAPHYTIGHVDTSIASIQRTFTFDGKSIYDALQEISEEIQCLCVVECYLSVDGDIIREINAYDLESYCPDCGERGNFEDVCPNCGESNVVPGYGEDTTVYISTDNLADSIEYSTDTGSVKNCFRLVAGDDLMTATIANCNPNGSGYIWYISDDVKEDMSDELVEKLESYDQNYNYYYEDHETEFEQDAVESYNALVDLYQTQSQRYRHMRQVITGYPGLMQAYYDTIDFYLYLNNSMMPTPEMISTTAYAEASKVNNVRIPYVAVRDINAVSDSSVNSAVLSTVKTIVDNRYQVKIVESQYSQFVWTGRLSITNYSNDEDTATTASLSFTISGDFDKYVKQMIDVSLSKSAISEESDIVGMFKMSDAAFKIELGKYSYTRLQSILDACQACLNILTEQGISNDKFWAEKTDDLYKTIYLPMYNKLGFIESEIIEREAELKVINTIQSKIIEYRNQIQSFLNFEEYLGEDLWLEFSAYRREDEYSNSNYISDGLDNAEIINNALQFIEVAKKEIFKSATLQHQITASLKNLLVIKGFEPIVDHFEIGNWIRVRSDGELHKLRLIGYQMDFNNTGNLPVTFSDVKKVADGVSDLESIVNQASSMASSYSYVARQAQKGSDSNSVLSGWVENGLSLTNMKIVNSADNQNVSWDEHGILCKEYIPEYDEYDDRQLKIINRGLYLTDDAWLTSRAGIGDFIFFNPKTGQFEESYGVIADTLVGNLVLSKEVGIYNEAGSITLDDNGLTVTADKTSDDNVTPTFVIQKKYKDLDDEERIQKMLYMDTDGNVVLNAASVHVISSSDPTSVKPLDEIVDVDADAIAGSVMEQTTEFIQNNNEIILSVFEGYSKVSDLESLKQDVETRFSVLPDSISIQISNATNQKFSDLENNFQEQIDNITAHYRFTNDGQYIGLEGSDAIMRLFNDVMQIIVSGNVATEVDRNGLTATVANIMTLFLGDYTLRYNPQDGHLTLT